MKPPAIASSIDFLAAPRFTRAWAMRSPYETLMSCSTEFQGFEPLTGNFLYCPNQFFEVCLPNYSRGVVRLVAFMLRKTLGWLDKDGNPIGTFMVDEHTNSLIIQAIA